MCYSNDDSFMCRTIIHPRVVKHYAYWKSWLVNEQRVKGKKTKYTDFTYTIVSM